MAQFCLNVRLSVRETEPTGKPCDFCQDTPYLMAAKAVVVLRPGVLLPAAYLCCNCADLLQERMDAGHVR